MERISPPFSARNRGPHAQIDGDFPESARNGLLHLLYDLVERKYVSGWPQLARELQRIGRQQPIAYNCADLRDIENARSTTEDLVPKLRWDNVYDFCERVHSQKQLMEIVKLFAAPVFEMFEYQIVDDQVYFDRVEGIARQV